MKAWKDPWKIKRLQHLGLCCTAERESNATQEINQNGFLSMPEQYENLWYPRGKERKCSCKSGSSFDQSVQFNSRTFEKANRLGLFLPKV